MVSPVASDRLIANIPQPYLDNLCAEFLESLERILSCSQYRGLQLLEEIVRNNAYLQPRDVAIKGRSSRLIRRWMVERSTPMRRAHSEIFPPVS